MVGHRDTVPDIVAALSGVKHVPPMGEDEYGTMYIVIGAAYRTRELHAHGVLGYGGPQS